MAISEEARKRMSESAKKRKDPFTPEVREKMRQSRLRYHREHGTSEESREKNRLDTINRWANKTQEERKEHGRKCVEARELNNPGRYNKKEKQPRKEYPPVYCIDCGKQIYRYSKRCVQCSGSSRKGDKVWNWKGGNIKFNCDWCGIETETTQVKYNRSKVHFCGRPCFGKYFSKHRRGDKVSWYKGSTPLHRLLRNHFVDNSQWRKGVFYRDNWTCQQCGDRCGSGHAVILHAHHIKSFKSIIEEYNIKSIEDAENCAILNDISNGITLCKECHKQEHKRLRKVA